MDKARADAMSSRVAAVFNLVAETYDGVPVPWFTPIAQRLVAEIAPRSGERALDIGTGRGAALWPLVDAVGPTGHVTALDLAEKMIESTRREAGERRLAVDFAIADAMSPQLPARSYDLAVASLVLFFMPDPAVALAAWFDLLVPGGRVGVSTFGPRDAAWEAVDGVFTPYLPPQLLDARTSGTSGPFASDAGVEDLLVNAGFVSPRTAHLDLSVHFTDVAQWQEWSMSHGQRQLWLAVPANERGSVLARAAELLEAARAPGGGFSMQQQVRYTLAAVPR